MIDAAAAEKPWRGLDILVVSPTPTHPRDHGNRKRIYEVCAELKRQGAKIHFVHYPAEHDWREAWPTRQEDAMRAEWETYHLVPPSRPLHTGAAAADHTIDEWLDPNLQNYIGWVCQRRAYDAIVVNYTWMSFCLAAAPDDVFKILDTHDVFAGRREMLQAQGVDAEFFHTTKKDEATGTGRAHLVWAIKPTEQIYFEKQLGVANCLTLLHAEPDRGWWRGPPSDDGWLRAGTIGARNNVNRRNLEAFLDAALPVFEHYWAPVKIVIAGGCSEDFETLDHPNVEVLGRVENVADFYRSIDVAIAPIQFGTGLKIKVAEALASGAPVIAHAHAMEGFPSRERLHRLTSFESMARELAGLAFERSPLNALAAKSREVNARARAEVGRALQDTRGQLLAFGGDTLLIVVAAEAFDPKSLLNDHLHEAADYLRFAGKVAIYIAGPAWPGLKFDGLERYGIGRRQFVDPETMRGLGTAPPETFVPLAFEELLDTRGYRRAYLMTDLVAHSILGIGGLSEVYVRQDAIALAGGDPAALIEDLATTSGALVVIDSAPSRLERWRDETGVTATAAVPFRRNGAFKSFTLRAKPSKTPTFLLLLARQDDPVGAALLALAKRLGQAAKRLDPDDAGFADVLLGRIGAGEVDPLADFANVRLVIDLSGPNGHAAILGEAALRRGIPRLTLPRGTMARSYLAFPDLMHPASIGELFKRVAEAALDRNAEEAMRTHAARLGESLYKADAGWSALWKLLTKPRPRTAARLPRGRDAAAALWG